MNDTQFLNIMGLLMVNTKMNMQIIHCLVTQEKYKEWDDAFKLIVDKYDDILKELSNELPNNTND